MDYINAFWVGGLICALVQILMEKTKMMPGRIMVLLVVTGAVLSALGWYEPFQDFAGAGASVPLLGFGNVLGNISHPSNSRFAKELPLRAMPSHGGLHHKQALTAAADIRQLTLAPIVRSSTESPVYEPPPDSAAFGLYTPLE